MESVKQMGALFQMFYPWALGGSRSTKLSMRNPLLRSVVAPHPSHFTHMTNRNKLYACSDFFCNDAHLLREPDSGASDSGGAYPFRQHCGGWKNAPPAAIVRLLEFQFGAVQRYLYKIRGVQKICGQSEPVTKEGWSGRTCSVKVFTVG